LTASAINEYYYLFINTDKCTVVTTSAFHDRSSIQAAGLDLELITLWPLLHCQLSQNGSCEKHWNSSNSIWKNETNPEKQDKPKVKLRLYESIILSTWCIQCRAVAINDTDELTGCYLSYGKEAYEITRCFS